MFNSQEANIRNSETGVGSKISDFISTDKILLFMIKPRCLGITGHNVYASIL